MPGLNFVRSQRLSIAATFAVSFLSSSLAQTTVDALPQPVRGEHQGQSLDTLAGGVILNRTMTIVGHDFYQYFASAWRTRDNNERYSITIIERPTAIRGSEVWVEYRNKQVFRTFLSPRRSSVRETSRKAVNLVYNAVTERELQQLLYQDQDLAKEELQ